MVLCFHCIVRGQAAYDYCYWFDSNYDQRVTGNMGGVLTVDADVSALSDGLHALNILVNGDAPASVCSRYFLKMPPMQDVEALTCVFTVDGTKVAEQSVSVGTALQHLDIDVAQLSTGLHKIEAELASSDGCVLGRYESFFKRMSPDGNGVVGCRYWVNDNGNALQDVTIEAPDETVSLAKLIPVDPQPIRSRAFAFKVADGVPTVYAQNELHVQLENSEGCHTYTEASYVDYNTSAAVTDIAVLSPNSTSNVGRIQENTIKWFTVDVERGDSLQFKSSTPCTLQLFDALGNTLYQASGADAVQWGGCRVPTTDVFYLAMHDPTASAASGNISLEYNHIDKYALLNSTPAEIGVTENLIDIELDGNGYDKLQNVRMVLGTQVISADSITVYDKSHATAHFYYSGQEAQGSYDLLLDFEDDGQAESICAPTPTVLAAPVWGEVKTAVMVHRSDRSPFQAKISVTNTGNVPYHFIPINIAYDNPDAVEQVTFSNFSIPFDDEAQEAGYDPVVQTDNLAGEHQAATFANMFIPELKPYETLELTMEFETLPKENIGIYAWTGEPANSQVAMTGTPEQKEAVAQEEEKSNAPSLSYYIEKLKTCYDVLKDLRNDLKKKGVKDADKLSDPMAIIKLAKKNADIAEKIGHMLAGIQNGIHNRLHEMEYNNIEETNRQYLDETGFYRPRKLESPAHILGLDKDKKYQCLMAVYDMASDNAQKKTPTPAGESVAVLQAWDPNEITGFVAESGSLFMPASLPRIEYTIECENDPVFATAPAQTIVVRDTISAATHDLSTFAATSVKIGSKVLTLNGEKQFKRTLDLRPAMNVIALVSLDYNESTGVACWTITSLDPMTIEPTDDPLQGALPVNTDGNGQAELAFSIAAKTGLADGAKVTNRAGIVFDQNATIMTNTWTNTVDAIAPTSRVDNVEQTASNQVAVSVVSSDQQSGPWKYDIYISTDDSPWERAAKGIPADSVATVTVSPGKSYKFYSLCTDLAGNIEQKTPLAEFAFTTSITLGDVNGDGTVDVNDVTAIVNHIQGVPSATFVEAAADVNGDGTVDVNDVTAIVNTIQNK